MKWKRGDYVLVKAGRREVTGKIVAFGYTRDDLEGAIVRVGNGHGGNLPRPPGHPPNNKLGIWPLCKLEAVSR